MVIKGLLPYLRQILLIINCITILKPEYDKEFQTFRALWEGRGDAVGALSLLRQELVHRPLCHAVNSDHRVPSKGHHKHTRSVTQRLQSYDHIKQLSNSVSVT